MTSAAVRRKGFLRVLFAASVAARLAAAQVVPPEPLEAPAAQWRGDAAPGPVAVTCVVAADGTVTEVQIEGEAPPDVAAAALSTARAWRFAPARQDGTPVAARIRVLIPFTLAPSGEPAAPGEPAPAGEPASAEEDDPEAQRGEEPDAETFPPASPAPAASPVPPTAVPASKPEAAPDAPVEVVVTGERHADPPASGSDYHIDAQKFRAVPRRNAQQLLTLAPGVVLTNHGGALHAAAIFLRGFQAEEGQDVEFTADGVPVNEVSSPHGHGYADMGFVIPELVDELRVVEGPFDPRQGDFAVAGSAEYHIGLPFRGVRASAGYGSFDERRFVALWGPKGERRGTYVGFDASAGDGFGPNRAHSEARVMAGYEHALDPSTRISVSASSYAGEFESAGLVRSDDFEAKRLPCERDEDSQFFCLYDDNQGGALTRHGMNARLTSENEERALSAQVFFTSRRSRFRENFTGFLTDLSSDPPRGDGLEQRYDADTFGSRGHYTWFLDLFGHRQEAELGFYARFDRAGSRTRRLRRTDGVPYAILLDNDVRVTNVAGYAAGRVVPAEWVVFRGGVRVDTFQYAVESENRPASDGAGGRLTSDAAESLAVALSPRGSVELRAAPELSWFTSYGMGTRSSDAQGVAQGEAPPFARVHAVETGPVWRRNRPGDVSAGARLTGFATHVDRDLVFDEELGRNEPVGASNRFGAVLASNVSTGFGLDAQGSVTWSEAYLSEDGAAALDLTSGDRFPYVPRWAARADVALRRPFFVPEQRLEYGLALGGTYVARRPLPLNAYGKAIFAVDASARLRWEFAEISLEVTNLFDRRNHEAELAYASNFVGPEEPASLLPELHFAAGAPRTLFGALTLYWGAPVEPRP